MNNLKITKFDIIHIVLAVALGLMYTLSSYLYTQQYLTLKFIAIVLKTAFYAITGIYIFYQSTESDKIQSKIKDIFTCFIFPLLISTAIFNFIFSILATTTTLII
jgi:hypothetical protein